MSNKLIFRYLISIVASLSAFLPSFAQRREWPVWEVGAGAAASNYTRVVLSQMKDSDAGYEFALDDRYIYGGGSAYLATGITPWLYFDFQGTLGLVSGIKSDGSAGSSIAGGRSILAGPGVQLRPIVTSIWIEPYFRAGLNIFHKTFPSAYNGVFSIEPSDNVAADGLGSWRTEDGWNKGSISDRNTYATASVGMGVMAWLSSRVGLSLQADYDKALASDAKNFVQGSLMLALRFGGPQKKKHEEPVVRYEQQVVEKYIEVPVEKVVEKIVTVPSEKTVAELMDDVHFEFDKAVLTKESLAVLDELAQMLKSFDGMRFLVAGYTDARGSDKYNEALSERRAKAVYDALIKRGVDKDSLAWRGFGKRVAVIPYGETELHREGDRRVSIQRITSDAVWKYLKQAVK